jgi:hypothetical protein
MVDASWIIEDRATGKPVLETFDLEMVQFINVERYRVWTALHWLQEMNHRISENNS